MIFLLFTASVRSWPLGPPAVPGVFTYNYHLVFVTSSGYGCCLWVETSRMHYQNTPAAPSKTGINLFKTQVSICSLTLINFSKEPILSYSILYISKEILFFIKFLLTPSFLNEDEQHLTSSYKRLGPSSLTSPLPAVLVLPVGQDNKMTFTKVRCN